MTTVLTGDQRKQLDTTVQKAREISELAARDALTSLGVGETHRPAYLDDTQNQLRLALRAKARQLGADVTTRGADLTPLMRDVAYEQWHRLLFARFLERNELLRHADFPDTPVTISDCDELATAGEVDEPDGWSVAASFAARLLPGVFRLDDPAFQVRYATEHRLALEDLLMSIPESVFEAEDALGWVYQFWQTAEKKRVNEAGNKIGGADLSPVTQLFTENYMVRFLLENSLGAWWAARHPDSPLVEEWEYLRRLDDGTPAAGTFDEWPATAAEVTVMDPCCGSGHFLVAMFRMLWRMRAEEEGLPPTEAQDAVLRDNLFGLELDARCTQIATFNLSLEAWKQGGYRTTPPPQIACSGVPVRQSLEDWIGSVPEQLREQMSLLHAQFLHAETLGSLIDPLQVDHRSGQLLDRSMTINASWDELYPHVSARAAHEGAAASVLGHAAEVVVHAAKILAGRYTLVATNPPWMGNSKWPETLREYAATSEATGTADLATLMFENSLERFSSSGVYVLPQSLASQSGTAALRKKLLDADAVRMAARLGHGAFQGITGQVVQPILLIVAKGDGNVHLIDTLSRKRSEEKASALKSEPLTTRSAKVMLASKSHRISFANPSNSVLLGDIADYAMGIQTGDNERFTKAFWELSESARSLSWSPYARSPERTSTASGRSLYLNWQGGDDAFMRHLVNRLGATGVKSWLRGERVWGRKGVLISRVGANRATLYSGDYFADNAIVLTPKDSSHIDALWRIASDPCFTELIDEVDSSPSVTGGSVAAVHIPRSLWEVALEDSHAPPTAQLPDDPTQWQFRGDITTAAHPLQVAMARLAGYRWPGQTADNLDRFADSDGIVALPDLGEGDASSRLRELLVAAYSDSWTSALGHSLVTDAGVKTGSLDEWLRDSFFEQHCKTFDQRPFLWHIWDGRKDGFSAIVNYHRFDHSLLQKLTYTTLGTWIQRQLLGAKSGDPGAQARLDAARSLQSKLEHIIAGAPPYDIYVRWKELHEQPLGWDPDLDDGVRLNIRPFVNAGILRSKVGVHWKKDRGKNPDGSERHNDLHFTLEEKRAARRAHGVSDA